MQTGNEGYAISADTALAFGEVGNRLRNLPGEAGYGVLCELVPAVEVVADGRFGRVL